MIERLGPKGTLLSGENVVFNQMSSLMKQEANPAVQQMRFMTSLAQQGVWSLDQQLAREKAELRTLLLTQALKTQKMVEPLLLSLLAASNRDLIDNLHDKNPLIRWFSADILSRRQVHAEKNLIPLLKDDYPDVRTAARHALVRLARGTDFGPDASASQVQADRAIGRWQNWLALQGPLPRPPPRYESPGENPFDRYLDLRKPADQSRK